MGHVEQAGKYEMLAKSFSSKSSGLWRREDLELSLHRRENFENFKSRIRIFVLKPQGKRSIGRHKTLMGGLFVQDFVVNLWTGLNWLTWEHSDEYLLKMTNFSAQEQQKVSSLGQ